MIVQVMMIIMIKMTDNGIGDRSNGSAKSSFAQQCHFSSTLRGARRPSPPTAPCPEWTAQATSASCARRTWWQQPSSGGPPARTSPAASSTDRSPAGFTAHPLALPCVEVHQLPLLGILSCCSILPLISCSLFWLIWKNGQEAGLNDLCYTATNMALNSSLSHKHGFRTTACVTSISSSTDESHNHTYKNVICQLSYILK